MGRQTVQIAEICPADIIAEAGIPDDDMAVLDEHPREQERLDHAIANAVTSLLPDALVVSMREHTDRETGHVTRYWKVLQALDPATKRIGGPLGQEDDETRTLWRAALWASDPAQAAKTVNAADLVQEAVRQARMADEADV
jgi:hypothetical protein